MVVVDTNVLLHAVNRDAPDHAAARETLEGLVNGLEPWALSWSIFYEYLRVATHPKVFPAPLTLEQAYRFIVDLMGGARCSVLTETEMHQQLVATCMRETHRLSGNLVHDFHTAVLLREHGVKEIITLDTDFKAFSWVKIRPLGGSSPRHDGETTTVRGV